MKLGISKLDDDTYHAVNLADYDAQLNSTDGMPDIMRELRQATNMLILEQARKPGQFAVKIACAARPCQARVRGYATFYSFVQGSNLAELEQKLGFKSGVLQAHGAYVYHLDGLALNAENIAPRGYTDWSAGITPRDLANLSAKNGVAVANHRDYPSATKPIPQFVVLNEVPIVGEPRFIRPGGTV